MNSSGTYFLHNTTNVTLYLCMVTVNSRGNFVFSDFDVENYIVSVSPNEQKDNIKLSTATSNSNSVAILISDSDAQYFNRNDIQLGFTTTDYPTKADLTCYIDSDTSIQTLKDYKVISFGNYNYWGDRTRDVYIYTTGQINIPTSTYCKITQNITNCKLNNIGDGVGGIYTIDTIPINSLAQFNFTLNDGYQWDTVTITNTDTGDTIATAEISDKTQSTVNVTVNNTVENMTINASAIEKQIEYSSVTLNLTGCTLSDITDGLGGKYTIDTIPVNNPVQFTLKRDNNTLWNSANVVNTATSETLATAQISDKSYTTVSLLVNNATSTMTVNGITTVDSIPIYDTCTYCTETHEPETLNRGNALSVIFNANNGYYFESLPVIRVNYSTGYQDYDCILNDDGTIATGNITGDITGASDLTKPVSISLIGVASIKPEIPTVTNSLIKAYKITQNGLKQLASKRWNVQTSEGQETIDLGYYITSLKKFYFDVQTSLDTTLVLYTYDTQIPAKIVSGDTVILDCGNVTIERPNNNINDYSNTEVQIMLPFIGFVTVDSDLVVGKTISINYEISTITGDCVAKITVNDIVINEYNGNCSEDVPYILNNIQWQLKGSVSFNSSSLYGLKPFVIVKYHDNYNSNDNIIVNDNNRTVLSNLHGLNYINDVVTDGLNINDDTKQLLLNTLANGVIFDD